MSACWYGRGEGAPGASYSSDHALYTTRQGLPLWARVISVSSLRAASSFASSAGGVAYSRVASQAVPRWIAESRVELEQAKLLTLKCAWLLNREGHHGGWRDVSLVKLAVPAMLQWVADRALQVFGAMGGTDDVPIHHALAYARLMRIGDGPDEVHLRQVFRQETPPAWTIAESPYVVPALR